MKITEDVGKYATEQEISDERAITEGMPVKSKEFAANGAELYQKA